LGKSEEEQRKELRKKSRVKRRAGKGKK